MVLAFLSIEFTRSSMEFFQKINWHILCAL
uniref:Uncharacterized protein n=1 Tax=Rhizophora mucronata TaxID=61149 RepID=A0A2P2QHT6_RHIMU